MLVLTRKQEESVMIGDNIEIKVLEIKRNEVKFGIKAPKEISIYRKEIYDSIVLENKLASRSKD